jgi:hypothetical protein
LLEARHAEEAKLVQPVAAIDAATSSDAHDQSSGQEGTNNH